MGSNKAVNHVRYSAEDWRGLVSEFSNSTLDRDSFCQSKGMSPLRLLHWQKVLRSDGLKLPASKIKSSFVDLGALKAEAPSLELKLDLGGNVVLTITRR